MSSGYFRKLTLPGCAPLFSLAPQILTPRDFLHFCIQNSWFPPRGHFRIYLNYSLCNDCSSFRPLQMASNFLAQIMVRAELQQQYVTVWAVKMIQEERQIIRKLVYSKPRFVSTWPTSVKDRFQQGCPQLRSILDTCMWSGTSPDLPGVTPTDMPNLTLLSGGQ